MISWKTKEGVVIPIKKMSDTHLLNTKRYIEARARMFQDRAISNMYYFLDTLQGEMARLSVEQQIDMAEEESPIDTLYRISPQYVAICEEIEERGLENVL